MSAPTAERFGDSRGTVAGAIRSLRPHQWIKNVLVFAALVFSLKLLDVRALALAGAGFAAFCLLSSFVYLINDITDREQDWLHPIKRLRPIASGQLPVAVAATMAGALLVAGLGVAALLGQGFLVAALAYVATSFAYCFALKRIVILDVMVLALGYALRAIAGAEAIDVDFSSWLLLCTSLLALFLGFCKRRQELVSLEGDAVAHREVLAGYSVPFIDQMIGVVTASTVVAYIFYALSDDVAANLGTPYLGLTIPFVLFGIFRYLYLVHQRGEGDNPTLLVLRDLPLLGTIVLWGAMVVLALYVLD